jgi:hypothetical protein
VTDEKYFQKFAAMRPKLFLHKVDIIALLLFKALQRKMRDNWIFLFVDRLLTT